MLLFDHLPGKLGHEDMSRVYRPKVVEAFVGLYIRKVACGSQSSLALTSTGQVTSSVPAISLHPPESFLICSRCMHGVVGPVSAVAWQNPHR